MIRRCILGAGWGETGRDDPVDRMSMESSHFDAAGQARMVDVAVKPETFREASARGVVEMRAETADMIRRGGLGKGDVLGVARLAGIAGAKQAAAWIPLCHPVRLTSVQLEFGFEPDNRLWILASVSAVDRTGVEMEALTAVSAAALTVYDMCKSVDRDMQILSLRLESKRGGRSGDYRRES